MGHASSGLYSILGAKQIETVYCDFTKPINAQGIMMLQNNKNSEVQLITKFGWGKRIRNSNWIPRR